MSHIPRTIRVSGLALAAAVACAAPQPPPAWLEPPLVEDARFLYFVGVSNGSIDQDSAREMAAQKALYELSVHCGARLTTDFSTVEAENNGELNQSATLTVEVAGEEITIQEATTDRSEVRRGQDGYDGYVRIKWPKVQFARVLAAKRASANRALGLLLDGEAAVKARDIPKAQRLVRETRKALGPLRGQIPLDHPKYTDSGLVYDATESLARHVEALAKARRAQMAVGVVCDENGATNACESRWSGRVKQRVDQAGFKLVPVGMETPTIQATLDGRPAEPHRDARFVLLVKYSAKHIGMEDGFAFARCGARGIVLDTDAKETVHVVEVKPRKGGHVHYEGAMKKGCEKAEAELMSWIDRSLGALKGDDK